VYTMEEVAKHTSLTDGWLVVESNVYDVSHWANQHPGEKKNH
jgi:cytochrome b involved in lipid metabolism